MSFVRGLGLVIAYLIGCGIGLQLVAPASAQTANNYAYSGKGWEPVPSCQSATVSVTAGSTTQIVALAAGQAIRVCGWSVTIGTAGTAKWLQGTGTNCGSNAADMTAATALAVGVPWSPFSPNGALLKTNSGFALCLAAVTGNVTGVLSYAQY